MFFGKEDVEMARDTITYWFVEPRNTFTNQVIASRLAQQNQAGEDRQAVVMLDDRGKSPSVWQVDYSFVAELLRSKRTVSLDFRVYNRRGDRGPIRCWKFGGKKKKRVLVFR